ncbi:putative nepenthesin [Helianthus annuus]|uniref:Putative aspartic peptidase A1 family, Aspartic peptidase domain, Xylanase inhibitor n=1 Tax=Helianthus annuus TaxID=4232 RepID=A0A251VBR5_HELAN|nr:putative nepenthesin [Helianthus annuus]KAJ0534768.1 putative nepenthesin [Helianthus annuus]KAJ0542745.1 putative nepenthesin [Helianthus annuus]KAJ0707808.1 putative nepenthesin [Helianthus annuus]KAJ0711781.1 putative nepenthesin [Helianthus annuus]
MHARINFLLHLLLALYSAFRFQGCASDAYHHTITAMKSPSSSTTVGSSASVFLQVTGNVYPQGHYYVTMYIGNPPKPYFLDIDTGSDLTWVQCEAPCQNCLPAPHPLYKPSKDLVKCNEQICVDFHRPNQPVCASPDQCDYDIRYADLGTSSGVLVREWFPLRYTNGTMTAPRVVFGCGYDQQVRKGATPPYLDGVLGLGLGKVARHLEPTSRTCDHYSLGTAEVFVGGKTSGMKDLPVLFDSGSTYTYFSEKPYKVILSLLMNDLKGTQLNKADEDKSLPICWKGSKPFKSIQDVRNLF